MQRYRLVQMKNRPHPDGEWVAWADVQDLQAIIAKLPKDANDDPIDDCRSYFVPCSNGAIELIAYLGPRCSGDSPTPYPWGKAHKTREAAEKAGEEDNGT